MRARKFLSQIVQIQQKTSRFFYENAAEHGRARKFFSKIIWFCQKTHKKRQQNSCWNNCAQARKSQTYSFRIKTSENKSRLDSWIWRDSKFFKRSSSSPCVFKENSAYCDEKKHREPRAREGCDVSELCHQHCDHLRHIKADRGAN